MKLWLLTYQREYIYNTFNGFILIILLFYYFNLRSSKRNILLFLMSLMIWCQIHEELGFVKLVNKKPLMQVYNLVHE